jgi:hypothetical protein
VLGRKPRASERLGRAREVEGGDAVEKEKANALWFVHGAHLAIMA